MFPQEGEPSWGQTGRFAHSLFRNRGTLTLFSETEPGKEACVDSEGARGQGSYVTSEAQSLKQTKGPLGMKNFKTKMAEHETICRPSECGTCATVQGAWLRRATAGDSSQPSTVRKDDWKRDREMERGLLKKLLFKCNTQ